MNLTGYISLNFLFISLQALNSILKKNFKLHKLIESLNKDSECSIAMCSSSESQKFKDFNLCSAKLRFFNTDSLTVLSKRKFLLCNGIPLKTLFQRLIHSTVYQVKMN